MLSLILGQGHSMWLHEGWSLIDASPRIQIGQRRISEYQEGVCPLGWAMGFPLVHVRIIQGFHSLQRGTVSRVLGYYGVLAGLDPEGNSPSYHSYPYEDLHPEA